APMFLCVEFDSKLAKHQVSNFGSSSACNLEVVGPEASGVFAKNSFIFVMYNTLQHDKSKLKLGLDEASIGDTIEESLNNLRNLPAFVQSSALRTEVYFELRNPSNLKQACNSVCHLSQSAGQAGED